MPLDQIFAIFLLIFAQLQQVSLNLTEIQFTNALDLGKVL